MIVKNKIINVFGSALVALSVIACKQITPENEHVESKVSELNSAESARQLARWPEREISPPRDESIEQGVAKILASMSIEEKVGQIIQPEIRHASPQDVRDYHLGSVLNGGGTRPNDDKFATVDDWVDLAAQYHEASMDTSDGKTAIPLIWGSDAIHGNNNLFGATLFPHNIGLGAARDVDMISRIGRATALELAATGVTWTFGPTVAVVRDVRWGRTYESYSEDPKIVADYARAMVQGIQGDGTPGKYNPNNVVATAKHFLGDGGTNQGIDRGDTMATEQELIDIHAAGYIAALDSNVSTTMASFNSWNGDRLHGHKYLITEVLKGRMGFDGLVVSDWNGHQHVPNCNVERCAASVNAGIDILMVPSDWKALLKNTIKDVQEGTIPMARLDDAVTRVLRVKMRAGLFEAGPVKERDIVGDKELIGHPDHRTLAREAVRKSLVLLKNNDSILPISPSANVLVAGDAADNIGKQAGGWTLSWQGTGNTNDDFPGATSVFAGIEAAVKAGAGQSYLNEDGDWDQNSFANGQKPDVAIVVYGEEPYAEWHGDIANIEYQYGSKQDINLLKKLKSQGIPVVSIFISGRPLWTNKEINASDAFVAAWLPGTEGAGVSDVLFANTNGKLNYDFSGKLSFSWPNTVSQAKLNFDDESYEPLFPYGYGLSYGAGEVPELVANNALDESGALSATAELEEYWLFVSREMSAWKFNLQDQGAETVVVNGNREFSSEDKNVVFEAVDRVAQQDARRVNWNGIRPATLSMTTPFAQNFSRYVENGAALSFDLLVSEAPTDDVYLGLICGDDCSNKINIVEDLRAAQSGEYASYRYPLSCFKSSDESTLSKLTGGLVINTSGQLDISLANIKVLPNVDAKTLNSCDLASMNK